MAVENKDGDKVAGDMVIKPDAVAKDFDDIDCNKLTAAQLNKLTDAKACAGLTAKCVACFDVTQVNAICLTNIPTDEWKEFKSQTVEQITNSDVTALNLTVGQFEAILPKFDLERVNENFARYVVRKTSLLDTVLEKGDGKIMAAFINAKTLPALPLDKFTVFSDKFIAHLKEDAFTGIQLAQLHIIPNDAFAGFYPKQWAKVAPSAIPGLTEGQASKLRIDCWEATTPEQINNFGLATGKFQAMNLDQNNALDRRNYKEQHACNAFVDVKDRLGQDKAKAFEERCKEVFAYDFKNRSNALVVSSTLAITMTAFAILFI